ncbi:MAG: molybdopterin molybdotransferase MoeA [Azospirillaceae bacterium]
MSGGDGPATGAGPPTLADDCFAADDPPMRLDEALARLDARIGPVAGIETVALAEAGGRVLAEDAVADRAIPPHDNAAVDGYAVFFDDLAEGGAAETRLPVAGRIAAGHPVSRTPRRGEAWRVLTGAPMPGGPGSPDTIFMQEDCAPEPAEPAPAGPVPDGAEAGPDPAFVRLPAGIRRGANYRLAGEDVGSGDTVLRAGRVLRPADVGMLAALGRPRAAVYRRLRAAVLSTGDEVNEPGTPLPPGGIYDANRYQLLAGLRAAGLEVIDLGVLRDDRQAIGEALARGAAAADVVVSSGGMSTGAEDHVRAAVEGAGGRLWAWRLAVKPGRPVALGRLGPDGRGPPFIGLPGNPVAVAVSFEILARPLLARLAGATPTPPRRIPVRAGFAMTRKPGRREFVRARLSDDKDGAPVAERYPRDGAGILSSMLFAEGFVELAEDTTEVREGETVWFRMPAV